jgi:hypothetical protein
VDETAAGGLVTRPAAVVLRAAESGVREILAGHVLTEGETTWADLVTEATTREGIRLAIVEAGTHGALGALLAEVPALERQVAHGPAVARDVAAWPVEDEAVAIARDAGVEIGLALVAHTDETQTLLRAAVAAPDAGWSRILDLRLFQHGAHGRFRAAVAAAAFLVEVLGEDR